jgi:hypothetical protein
LHRILDFNITKNKLVTIVKSQSFSVYSPGEITLRVLLKNPPKSPREFILNTTKQEWTHFTLVVVNRNLYILQNGDTVRNETLDFEPNAITFKRDNESYWKFHESKYFENIIVNDALQFLSIQISLDGQIRVQFQTKQQVPLPFHQLQKNV